VIACVSVKRGKREEAQSGRERDREQERERKRNRERHTEKDREGVCRAIESACYTVAVEGAVACPQGCNATCVKRQRGGEVRDQQE
jgi:hypothetical protein